MRAARGEAIERVPVWAMRQAGRWDPEFNRVRAGRPFYEFSEDVDGAAEASLCPRRFGVDAIILFYDITTLTVAMGLPFTLQPNRGPVPDHPIRSRADVDRLAAEPDPEQYRHILDLLARVRHQLAGELPVIVFAGAPFTVATYCLGTGKDMDATRQFAAEQPEVWRHLLERLSTATMGFLNTLCRAGADLYQLFDSWAGLLTRAEYDQWAHPYHQSILAAAAQVPRILFVKECPYPERLAVSGAEVLSLGMRHDLSALQQNYPGLIMQGNVDQSILRTGTPEQVAAATQACLDAGGGQRHILNLNHGVDRSTPVANFQAYVQAAKAGVRSSRSVQPSEEAG